MEFKWHHEWREPSDKNAWKYTETSELAEESVGAPRAGTSFSGQFTLGYEHHRTQRFTQDLALGSVRHFVPRPGLVDINTKH